MAAQSKKSSFIPKKTLSKEKSKASGATGNAGGGGGGGPKKSKGSQGGKTFGSMFSGNLFLVVGIIIFLGTGAVAGGMYGYQYFIQSDIEEKSRQLEAAEEEIDPKLIDELERLDAQFSHARGILAGHETLTPFFGLLERNTVRAVSFKSFQYSKGNDAHSVSLEGQADSYMTLALQSDVLNDAEPINGASFSNLTLNDDGNIEFKLTASVNSSLFSYSSDLAPATSGGNNVNETP
jgi:hypothetical protein